MICSLQFPKLKLSIRAVVIWVHLMVLPYWVIILNRLSFSGMPSSPALLSVRSTGIGAACVVGLVKLAVHFIYLHLYVSLPFINDINMLVQFR